MTHNLFQIIRNIVVLRIKILKNQYIARIHPIFVGKQIGQFSVDRPWLTSVT